MYTIEDIAKRIEEDLASRLNGSGIMFRLFRRVKAISSMAHKMEIKGDSYRGGKSKIQDIIGLRVVVYFSDDVDVVSFLLNNREVVKRSVDEPDSCTFQPQRLNLTSRIPEEYVEDFRVQLPAEYAQFIDDTYEVQIRTVFSEGWHEVEHDLRYKCKEDWVGHESYSRQLNGVIATLETAEWSMQSVFKDLSYQNYREGNYTAMLCNKFRIRIKGSGLSAPLHDFLSAHPEVAKAVYAMDRTVFLLSLMIHKKQVDLTFDNILFVINRLEIQNEELMALEPEDFKTNIEEMFLS